MAAARRRVVVYLRSPSDGRSVPSRLRRERLARRPRVGLAVLGSLARTRSAVLASFRDPPASAGSARIVVGLGACKRFDVPHPVRAMPIVRRTVIVSRQARP